MTPSDVLGVRCTTPEVVVQIEGQTFAEIVAHLGIAAGLVYRIQEHVRTVNFDQADEELCEAGIALVALERITRTLFLEHRRWAAEQGLQFEFDGQKPAGPSWPN